MNTIEAMNVARVLDEVRDERERQHAKWGEQQLPDGTGGDDARVAAEVAQYECQKAAREGNCTFRHIAAEEVAEAFAESDPAKLRAELVQCAAVFVQWIEAIDRRTP